MAQTFRWLFIALVLAVLPVYMVMAAQFESLVYPFIVMFSGIVTNNAIYLGVPDHRIDSLNGMC